MMFAVSKKIRLVVLVTLLAVGLGSYQLWKSGNTSDTLKLYGSIDMRTTTLAFEESARIRTILKREGEQVAVGELIGELDNSHQKIAYEQANAKVEVAQRELELLLAGTRREEIAEARARVAAALAAYEVSESECKRQRKLGHATSAQAIESACSQSRVTGAQLLEVKTSLSRLLAGTRTEEIDVAKANLRLAKSEEASAKLSLENCALRSPVCGVVRTRLKEPGDMVTAGTGVLEVALTDPKWARVWIDEANLGKIKMGTVLDVTCDAYPDEKFKALVGFISTVAEFTPKSVQTEEVRTSLVYEVRLTLEDPEGKLRLGMPVTARVRP